MRNLIRRTRRVLLWTEYALLLAVFLMLLVTALTIITSMFIKLESTQQFILTLLSNALLLLVIKEIIWTVFRFFNREKFSLSPFLYVGVISCIREILFLSVQKSFEPTNDTNFYLQILANAVVILLLTVAYYFFKQAHNKGNV